jgi:hypothetical protein
MTMTKMMITKMPMMKLINPVRFTIVPRPFRDDVGVPSSATCDQFGDLGIWGAGKRLDLQASF